MVVFDEAASDVIRQRYIETFVNTDSDYYNQRIKDRRPFSDGLCYTGYLWDCFKKPEVLSEPACFSFLKQKKNIYIMWDIHSAEQIFIPNYWKYPKSAVLLTDCWIDELGKELPEDLYLFDSSFTWSIALTHETDLKEKRYCVFSEAESPKEH